MATYILGLSAYYHDSAAALLRDGEIVAAAQEERFSRKKHDHRFPSHAVTYCLEEAGIDTPHLDHVAFYDKPFTKFERLLSTYLGVSPQGLESWTQSMPLWLKEKLFTDNLIRKEVEGYEGKILYGDHHESHVASAFYPSPFEEAAILTIDGVGEWASTTFARGSGSEIEFLKQVNFPHSLGLLYSAFTYYTGFKVNSGEYKVMGLAPYGNPCFVDLILENVLELKEDGSFWMDPKFFNFMQGLTMTNERFDDLFGGPPREAESELTQREMDLAASVQVVVEMAMIKMARYAREITGCENLCLAGGVALNCVGNGKILREKIFDNLWIQPAAGDAGGALGVAYSIWHRYLGKPRATPMGGDVQKGSLLGPSFTTEECRSFLERIGCPYREVDDAGWGDEVAQLLEKQNVVGLMQGRMEFGPRALGGRSIIGDTRSQEMQTKMNMKIKYRESFRPFAPAVLRERVSDYFEMDCDSPYMLLVAPVAEARRKPMTEEQKALFGIEKLNIPRSDIPAITHVDYSARVQTVSKESNRGFYEVIKAFEKRTDYGVVVNTSFNVRGEPIVCTPEDAYRCFRRTEMDALVLENLIIEKAMDLPEFAEGGDWREEFELD
jgi:carbamoyltransferase